MQVLPPGGPFCCSTATQLLQNTDEQPVITLYISAITAACNQWLTQPEPLPKSHWPTEYKQQQSTANCLAPLIDAEQRR
jgi:hypothetical protein